MTLYDIEKINIHGGSLRCFIKNSSKMKKTKRCLKILHNEKKNLNIKSFVKFNKEIEIESQKFKNALMKYRKNNKYVIGYGAPARVSTLTNFSNINQDLIKYIIDDSPLKQNRFSPGQHIKIVPRIKHISSKIDVVIVFAYEYFSDIKKNFKYHKVKFFKPIPFRILK